LRRREATQLHKNGRFMRILHAGGAGVDGGFSLLARAKVGMAR
jgi:hypothetical protein